MGAERAAGTKIKVNGGETRAAKKDFIDFVSAAEQTDTAKGMATETTAKGTARASTARATDCGDC